MTIAAEVETFSNIDQQRQRTALADVVNRDSGAISLGPLDSTYEKIIYQEEDSLDQWCAIRAIEYRYRADQIKSNENVVCDIMLPMPLQLQTGYNQQWTELDDISALIAQMASETPGFGVDQLLNNPSSVFNNFKGQIENAMKNLAGGGTSDLIKNLALNPNAAAAAGAIAGGAAGGLLGGENGATAGAAIGGVLAQATSRAIGTVGGLAANKYQTVTFEKPQLRQHQFSWNLIARNQKQATRIQRIIKKLKNHSSPKQEGSSSFGFFRYPELFALHFDGGSGNTKAKGNENLFSISPSAMSSFNVDYHGTGRPLYSYTDKQPLSVTISMTLQEVVVVTKNTIDDFNR